MMAIHRPFLQLPKEYHSQSPCKGKNQTEVHHLKKKINKIKISVIIHIVSPKLVKIILKKKTKLVKIIVLTIETIK